jgi:hypothetical protein
VKIRNVTVNTRKRQLELRAHSGAVYPFPYARLEPAPTASNRIVKAYVDPELGKEGVTYVLESGDEGSVHIDQALEYNEDPAYIGKLLVYELTVAALDQMKKARLSRREIARRLRTSLPQLYRLLDTTNSRKSINQLVVLLHVLGCDVTVEVKQKTAA